MARPGGGGEGGCRAALLDNFRPSRRDGAAFARHRRLMDSIHAAWPRAPKRVLALSNSTLIWEASQWDTRWGIPVGSLVWLSR